MPTHAMSYAERLEREFDAALPAARWEVEEEEENPYSLAAPPPRLAPLPPATAAAPPNRVLPPRPLSARRQSYDVPELARQEEEQQGQWAHPPGTEQAAASALDTTETEEPLAASQNDSLLPSLAEEGSVADRSNCADESLSLIGARDGVAPVVPPGPTPQGQPSLRPSLDDAGFRDDAVRGKRESEANAGCAEATAVPLSWSEPAADVALATDYEPAEEEEPAAEGGRTATQQHEDGNPYANMKQGQQSSSPTFEEHVQLPRPDYQPHHTQQGSHLDNGQAIDQVYLALPYPSPKTTARSNL